MRIKIGIYDRDFGYALALMEYINANANNRYEAACFSSERALEEFLINEQLHVLLAGESIEVGFSGVVIYLSGYDTDVKLRRIYKYQSAIDLLKDIERTTSEIFNKYDCGKLYFVYSPIGRSCKTILAKTLCKLRRDSLYLGFEEYGDIKDDFSEEFLFYLCNHNHDIIKYFDRKSIQIGFSFEDAREVDLEDFFWLKEIYLSAYPQGLICVDMGVGALGSMNVFLAGDKLLVPVVEDTNSANKLQSFYKKIEYEKLAGLKILEVKIDRDTNIEDLIGENDL